MSESWNRTAHDKGILDERESRKKYVMFLLKARHLYYQWSNVLIFFGG